MATSGSFNYNLTRNEIIKDALMLIGVVGAEETVAAADNALADRLLNSMVKAWQGQGIHLWTKEEAVLFLANTIATYDLSATSSTDVTKAEVITTLSADEAAAQTVLSVTSSTGMTAADIVLVELNDKTYEDTTIVSVDSSTQITITSALTSAAGSGNKVYTFTTRLNERPLSITSMRFRSDAGIDRAMNKLSRSEYFDLPDKASTGQPLSYYYDPQLTTGTIYVWPAPDRLDFHLRFTYDRNIEDFDAATDNPDFPQEWLETLTYQLALRLAPVFGRDQKLASIGAIASQMLKNMLDYDNENASLFITPERRFD